MNNLNIYNFNKNNTQITGQENVKNKRAQTDLSKNGKNSAIAIKRLKTNNLNQTESNEDEFLSFGLSNVLTPLLSVNKTLQINLLKQVAELNQNDWKWLQETDLPSSLTYPFMDVAHALCVGEDAYNRFYFFEIGIKSLVKQCEGDPRLQEIKDVCLRMIASMHTSINARKIHSDVLKHYTKSSIKQDRDQLRELFKGIPKKQIPTIVKKLGVLWDRARQSANGLNAYKGPNLPNKLFDVTVCESNKNITFFRMQSPENNQGELSPIYELFLDWHESQSTRHLSLIMLSPTVFDDAEGYIAFKRFHAQEEHDKSLFAWAFEPDTDFSAQDCIDEITEDIGDFMTQLDELISYGDEPSFDIPEHIRNNPKFTMIVSDILFDVKKALFPDHKHITPSEKRDFILMTAVLLLEHFCETENPSTVDTACRSHIDRGIMMSSVFYVYLMIKSGKQSDKEFQEYLKPFMLAPALSVAKRPPHLNKMRAALSLITRMLDPKVVKKLQEKKSYFSQCTLNIPSL